MYLKRSVHRLHVYITHIPESKRSVNSAREFFRHGIIFDGHFRYSGHSLCENAPVWCGERKPPRLISDLGFILWKIVYPRENEKRLVSEKRSFIRKLIDFYFKFCPARGLFRNVRAIITILRTAIYASTYSCYSVNRNIRKKPELTTWRNSLTRNAKIFSRNTSAYLFCSFLHIFYLFTSIDLFTFEKLSWNLETYPKFFLLRFLQGGSNFEGNVHQPSDLPFDCSTRISSISAEHAFMQVIFVAKLATKQ